MLQYLIQFYTGFLKWEEMEKVKEKYLRWILGVDSKTPGYIVKEEMKRRERFSANVEREQ